MKQKSLILLIFSLLSFCYNSGLAQRQHVIDSLTQKLSTATDEEKINILFGLSWSYKFSNPQLAYEYGLQANKLSKKVGNAKYEAKSLNRMGAAKLKLGDLNESLKLLLVGVEICRVNNFYKILATTLRQIGDVYEAQGNNSEAMKYYYNSLGITDSLEIPIIKARSAKKVANLYIKLHNYKDAKSYLDYSLTIFEKENYIRGVHQIHILYGDYYFFQNLLDSARINYNLALDHLYILKDRQGYATAKTKIARVFEHEGYFVKAVEGYNEALDTFKVLGDKKQIVSSHIDLARVYTKNDNYKRGVFYGKMALEKAKSLNFYNEEKEANHILFSLYKKSNNLNLAIQYLESYMFLMDSLSNSSESWRIDQMRKSYDLEIEMKENALKSATISNQALTIKNERLLTKYLLAIIAAVCIIALIIWYSLNQLRKVNEQLLLANEEKNHAISLISHDLKSPFNKIKGLAHVLELQTEDTNDEFKDILSKINTVTFEGLTLVQNLVDIKALKSGAYKIKFNNVDLNDFILTRAKSFEQLAQTKNILLNFEPTKGVCDIVSDVNSISRIFDNLLSNAIKFSPVGETITIDCSIVKNSFSFSISDNGKGVAQEEIDQIFNKYKTGKTLPTGSETSSGLGLAIVSSLVNKLNGTIKCISEVNKGATFIVSMPLNKKGTV